MSASLSPVSIPLCVDLDGTLTPVDTLHESLLGLVGQKPGSLWRLPFWLLRGKATFKARVAAVAPLDVEALPWREDLLAWLRTERERGRRLVLVTASDRESAERVSRHLELFDEVLASDGARNLSGDAKRQALVERFGAGAYDYVANATCDLPVWRDAHAAILVDAPPSLRRRAAAQGAVQREFAPPPRALAALRAMRPHQWLKNILVFLPLMLTHYFHPQAVTGALLAFIAFCLCASSVYVLNDLLDLAADRRHPSKRKRPFAAGTLSAVQGLWLALTLLAAALWVAQAAGSALLATLCLYYLLTLAYSLHLKREPVLDVLVLAALYTIRIIAGAAATGVLPSLWLLAFSGFLFLSLGIVKRYAELLARQRDGGEARGRGYRVEDLPWLGSFGTAAGIGAVIVMALYVQSTRSQSLYTDPLIIGLLCPLLLYWIGRVWLLAYRGQMHDDPIVFALRDRPSLVTAALTLAALALAA